MIYVGIDPGLEGCIAEIWPCSVAFFDTPTVPVMVGGKPRRDYDLHAMYLELKRLQELDAVQVCLEKVHAMSTESGGIRFVSAMGNFGLGRGYGIWQALLTAAGIPWSEVPVLTWRSTILGKAAKDKDLSRDCAGRLYPSAELNLRRKKDHNRAEALLIAEYGRRQHVKYGKITAQIDD